MTAAKAARSPWRSCSISVWSADNNKFAVQSMLGGMRWDHEPGDNTHLNDDLWID